VGFIRGDRNVPGHLGHGVGIEAMNSISETTRRRRVDVWDEAYDGALGGAD
jgi:hypothetical protein